MNIVVKRYLITLVLALTSFGAIGAALGWAMSFEVSDGVGLLGGFAFVTALAGIIALVAREKGRSLLWALSAFGIAPLIPIIVLLPHTAARRAQLLGVEQARSSSVTPPM